MKKGTESQLEISYFIEKQDTKNVSKKLQDDPTSLLPYNTDSAFFYARKKSIEILVKKHASEKEVKVAREIFNLVRNNSVALAIEENNVEFCVHLRLAGEAFKRPLPNGFSPIEYALLLNKLKVVNFLDFINQSPKYNNDGNHKLDINLALMEKENMIKFLCLHQNLTKKKKEFFKLINEIKLSIVYSSNLDLKTTILKSEKKIKTSRLSLLSDYETLFNFVSSNVLPDSLKDLFFKEYEEAKANIKISLTEGQTKEEKDKLDLIEKIALFEHLNHNKKQ